MKSVSNHNEDIIVHQSTSRIKIQNSEITIISRNEEDYISLTDMARSQLQEHIIFKWLSLKSTIEYLGEWEMLYNPTFNCTEFGTIRNNDFSDFHFLQAIKEKKFNVTFTSFFCLMF